MSGNRGLSQQPIADPVPSIPTHVRVVRTETIEYVVDVSINDILEAGVQPDTFLEGDWRLNLVRAVEESDPLADFLVEESERHGNVQGSTFTFAPVPQDE